MIPYFDGVYDVFAYSEVLFLEKQEHPEIREARKLGRNISLVKEASIELDGVLVVFKDSLPCEDNPNQYDKAVFIVEKYTCGVEGEATRLIKEYKEYIDAKCNNKAD